jgi:branched-chain amino acid transport system ATP-binding protein
MASRPTPEEAVTRAAGDGAPSELRVREVVAGYHPHQQVLSGVSIHARPSHVTAILGPNGSGKSTLLRVLYGLLDARSGSVELGGQDITDLPADERLRCSLALLPQGRSLFPALTVQENMELGAWTLRKNRGRMQEAIDSVYGRFQFARDLRNQPAGSLSGGQQRLIELARLMITDPAVILIDEPSVGLAPKLADEIYEELWKLRTEGRTIVLVDQNVQAAVQLADYVYTLESGRNHREGTREDFEGALGDLIRQWLRLSTDESEEEEDPREEPS